MKILIVAAGFLPGKKYGGPPVSVDNFCSLMQQSDVYIVTSNHDMGQQTPYADIEEGWNDRGNCKVLYLPDSQYTKKRFEQVIREVQPDTIYLQGLFQSCVVPMLRLARKYNIRTVLAPRGELCAGAMRKKYKKYPYILALHMFGLLKNVEFQSTSEEETRGIRKFLKASDKRIWFLTNIPSVPRCQYRSAEKKAGQARLIFLSRIVSKKNLDYALDCLKTVDSDIVFHIYGSLEDAAYWKFCQDKIAQLPENVTVEYKGLLGHDAVHETFAGYDAFLFPTKSENYGHVIAESLVVGTPVIISDQTPWLDMEQNQAGWAIPLSAPETFSEKIEQLAALDAEAMAQMREHTRQYAENAMQLEQLRAKYTACFEQ